MRFQFTRFFLQDCTQRVNRYICSVLLMSTGSIAEFALKCRSMIGTNGLFVLFPPASINSPLLSYATNFCNPARDVFRCLAFKMRSKQYLSCINENNLQQKISFCKMLQWTYTSTSFISIILSVLFCHHVQFPLCLLANRNNPRSMFFRLLK